MSQKETKTVQKQLQYTHTRCDNISQDVVAVECRFRDGKNAQERMCSASNIISLTLY